MEELIRSIISTMDTISITGRDNMDKFLGCMNVLNSILNAFHESTSSESETVEREEPVNGGQIDSGTD